MSMPSQILIVEDDARVVSTLARALAARQLEVVVAAGKREAIVLASQTAWLAALVDMGLPEGETAGLEVVRHLRLHWPHRHVSTLTGRMDPLLDNALYELDCGVLRKCDSLLSVIESFISKVTRDDLAGRTGRRFELTAREIELCRVLFAGSSLPEAAVRMQISIATAKRHVWKILRKTAPLGARNMRELEAALRRTMT